MINPVWVGVCLILCGFVSFYTLVISIIQTILTGFSDVLIISDWLSWLISVVCLSLLQLCYYLHNLKQKNHHYAGLQLSIHLLSSGISTAILLWLQTLSFSLPKTFLWVDINVWAMLSIPIAIVLFLWLYITLKNYIQDKLIQKYQHHQSIQSIVSTYDDEYVTIHVDQIDQVAALFLRLQIFRSINAPQLNCLTNRETVRYHLPANQYHMLRCSKQQSASDHLR